MTRKNLVVLGAAGRTGRLIVEEALRAGHRVTAAVRTPENFPSTADPGLRVARADVRDPGGLHDVIAGHDVVVSAVGPTGRKAHGLYSDGARATVAAMRTTGVRRYLGITSVGVRHDDPHAPWWYRGLIRPIGIDLYTDMRRMEEIVRATDLDWTFVRPTYLQDREPVGTFRVADNVTPAGGWKITRGDVARFIVEEIERGRFSRRAPSLAE
ncbi:NmrA family transcriptional regulator [Actinoplanes ianthinogenes]|uniref:NmrA family transcriptional regulator n=1 Tax=Actinoplanes ianthinogenes TaxID=122358 RepID=A0ABN6CRY7_9ACTN|nr:SDR family oxidoreductase [Actinoplanes ianthinogenes]BCJ47967.1 NmrA family transcriptional regulator [Actinoplanes ianthinogenes]GGR05426.1 NmrA family transcriptional regulator [Actinoplanes ianthinogenes]